MDTDRVKGMSRELVQDLCFRLRRYPLKDTETVREDAVATGRTMDTHEGEEDEEDEVEEGTGIENAVRAVSLGPLPSVSATFSKLFTSRDELLE